MKKVIYLTALAILIAAGSATRAETVEGLPLHIQKLAPNAMRLWVGDYISSTATVAIATEKGIVVVDTNGNVKIDAMLRKVIERELRRDDFKTLINTHEHSDHVGGNSVYSDCMIVGHEMLPGGIAARVGDRKQMACWVGQRVAELEKQAGKNDADTVEAKRLHEELLFDRLNLDALKSEAKPVPPTKTFGNRMTMGMGDFTFELYYTGGMHSASDISILVPELGLLMTGDTMADKWLAGSPGCLASFVAWEGVKHDFPLLLENWGLILQRRDKIRLLLPGHWNAELSLKGFEERVNYVRTLWEGVNQGLKEGKGFEDILATFDLEKRFPELANSPGFNANNNRMTLFEMFIAAGNLDSAAEKLYSLIEAGAMDEAVNQILTARGSKPPRYYYSEGQINMAGYRFLQADKVPQAIRMFRANVELFPGSWNVYDSLGEGLLKAGDKAEAEKMYEKSVSIKPDSKTGLEALEKIRGTVKAE